MIFAKKTKQKENKNKNRTKTNKQAGWSYAHHYEA
jgi:hypothetical protein